MCVCGGGRGEGEWTADQVCEWGGGVEWTADQG